MPVMQWRGNEQMQTHVGAIKFQVPE